MTTTLTERIADRFTGRDCTLDGRPARIIGRKLDYAIVRPDDPAMPDVPYAWQTVVLVFASNGGAFRS